MQQQSNRAGLGADTSAKKIGPRTYRVGAFVAFQRSDGKWHMGRPIDWADPIGGGMHEGTVSYRLRLRDCVTVARLCEQLPGAR